MPKVILVPGSKQLTKQFKRDNAGNREATINNAATVNMSLFNELVNINRVSH